ncbi:cupin domain-containing protein [Sphingomonas sp. MMS24-J13]|uniref:cupin domain-containing protein n=1 Tax=Sphingomonas sp. MMS24-J13 TaxID=3238686 RepID=UPI0038504B97
MEEARAIIDRLGLIPHPEGGWYREMWRADAADGERAGGTAILFLLDSGERSHWHRVDGAEIWFWHAGAPLVLSTAPGDAGPVSAITLGGNVLAGEQAQGVVPPHHWQATEAPHGWGLVSCVVVPGFRFEGFTLAEPGWAPGQ